MIRKVSGSIKNITLMMRSKCSKVMLYGRFCQVSKTKSSISSSFTQTVVYKFSTQKVISKPQTTSNNALQSMQQIQKFVSSEAFKKNFNSYYYLQKYSWICIHTWMLLYRIRQCQNFSEVIYGYLFKKKILKLLQEYTREQVYEYDDIFDRQVYEELKRVQQVIFWSLDEYFVFGVREKGLGQIIEEDFSLFWDKEENANQEQQQKQEGLFKGLQNNQTDPKYSWEKEEQMKKVATYFLTKLQEIQKIQFDKIKKGQLDEWLKI